VFYILKVITTTGEQCMKKAQVLVISMLLLVCIAIGLINAAAYEHYEGSPSCSSCHPEFLYGIDTLHDLHVSEMTAPCMVCHTLTGDNPLVANCAGCHVGPGLRLHHKNAGVPADANGKTCSAAGCHPNDPTPNPENIAPPYYIGADVTVKNPCQAQPAPPGEDFDGDLVGLDNDGDLLYDTQDSDCTVTPTTTTTSVQPTTTTTVQPSISTTTALSPSTTSSTSITPISTTSTTTPTPSYTLSVYPGSMWIPWFFPRPFVKLMISGTSVNFDEPTKVEIEGAPPIRWIEHMAPNVIIVRAWIPPKLLTGKGVKIVTVQSRDQSYIGKIEIK
jgi:hypothetical protein